MITFLLLQLVVVVFPAFVFAVCGRKSIDFIKAGITSTLTCIGGAVWEQKAYGTVWILPADMSLKIEIFNIPIEQYCFFIFAPLLMISIYCILREENPILICRILVRNKPVFVSMTLIWPAIISAGFIVEINVVSFIMRTLFILLVLMHTGEYIYLFRSAGLKFEFSDFIYAIHSGIFAFKPIREKYHEKPFCV
ncbi:MAG: hypothetical protein JW982_09480 [Spirochaetes bacterium]|nr:hypothetical protein [Spirochaetota bacterium]